MAEAQSFMDFDRSKFNTESYVERVEKPWGFELHFVPETFPYMVKILHINAGARISLQQHVSGTTSPGKIETWVLHAGKGKILWEDMEGNMIETEMQPGKSYTSVVGQRHRLIADKDVDFEVFEASTPEGDGTTERLEDDYGRPDETVEMRKDPNRGWNPN
jgi:mannose-6-phosphate isomerase-like protein (cupin superfamily)